MATAEELLNILLDHEADETFTPDMNEEDDPGYGWCSCGCPVDENGLCLGTPPCSVNPEGFLTPGGR